MKRFKKCALSVLAATAMASAVVAPLAEPMKVLAADASTIDTWETDGITYTLYSNGLLTVEGSRNSSIKVYEDVFNKGSSDYMNDVTSIMFNAYIETTGAGNIYISCRMERLGKFSNVEHISFGDDFINNTSHLTSLAGMLESLPKLVAVNLNGWDTSNVTSTSQMFYQDYALKNLDFSSWNTSSLTNISQMFKQAIGLTSVNFSGWDTSKVTTMTDMFNQGGGKNIAVLNLSSFNLDSLTEAKWLFDDNWSSLTDLYITQAAYDKLVSLDTDDTHVYIKQIADGGKVTIHIVGPKNYTSDGDHNMEVSAEVTSHYTVQLPATLELSQSGDDLMHYAGDFIVGARGAINKNQIININCDNTSFEMTGSNGSTADATYGFTDNASTAKFKASSGEATDATALSNEGVFVNTDGKVEVTFPSADTYTGTASFTFSLQ